MASSLTNTDQNMSKAKRNSGLEFQFVNCDDYQCIICLKIIKNFVELPCGHAGCDGCIEKWEERHL